METNIGTALGVKFNPVAVILTDEKPADAVQFKQGKWGCVMSLFAACAKNGRSAAFDAQTYGCWGGGVGLGFGNAYAHFPGGEGCFTRFISSGNKEWEQGRKVGEQIAAGGGAAFAEQFLEGERYVKTPELVEEWLREIPIRQIDTRYVVFKPLAQIDPEVETPTTVVFTVNPDQLSALVILANYNRSGMENVCIPWAAGCQTIGTIPLKEGETSSPRAVVGLTDLSARKYVRAPLGDNCMTVALPFALFTELEQEVEGSFLQAHTWKSLQ
ncbi:MAG: DUF169 domain-containing protein [Desulfuromonas sp.]